MKIRNCLLSILILISSYYIYVFKLTDTTPFLGDLARDLNDILAISRGDIRLIGPKLSFGGIYGAPWYYYFFVPVYLFSGRSFTSILYFNAFLHSLSLALIYWLLIKKSSQLRAMLLTLVIGLLPLFIFSARNPGNAFTYQPLLFLWLVYYLTKRKLSRWDYVLGALSAGFLTSFHYILLLIFLPLWLYLIVKNWKRGICLSIVFCLPFLPLVLFEVTHGFVMLKNTFIDQSYKMFTENRNIPTRATGQKNVFLNLWQINQQLMPWIITGPLFWWIGLFFANLKKEKLTVGWVLTSLILFAVTSRYQSAFHYLLPLGLLSFTIFWLSVIKTRFFYLLGVTMIFIEVVIISQTRPAISSENYQTVKLRVEQALNKTDINQKSFNIVEIDENGRSSIGNQYRYFFNLQKLPPNTEYQYTQSESLLIYAPQNWGKQNLISLNNYEIRQFGNIYLKKAKIIEVSGKRLFVLSK